MYIKPVALKKIKFNTGHVQSKSHRSLRSLQSINDTRFWMVAREDSSLKLLEIFTPIFNFYLESRQLLRTARDCAVNYIFPMIQEQTLLLLCIIILTTAWVLYRFELMYSPTCQRQWSSGPKMSGWIRQLTVKDRFMFF